MNNDQTRKIPPNVHIFGLTFLFFAVGIGAFIIAMVAGIWLFSDLLNNQTVRSPAGWTLAHLFVLGWATMIAMGASYQLTQVILRTSLHSRFLGYVHFFFYVIGFLILTVSFYFDFFQGIAIGGTFVAVGVVIYVYNLMVTFVKKREWNVYIFGVGFSLLHLLVTVSLGIFMGLSFAIGWMPFDYQLIFRSHVWFGIVGWLSGLIITYSFKLLPMFYASPRKAVKEAYVILGLFQAGVWFHVIAQWVDWEPLEAFSIIFIFVSLSLFVRFVYEVRLQSRSKKPGGSVTIAYRLIYFVYALFIFWMITKWPFSNVSDSLPIDEMIILFLIVGWFSATIFSYFSKIFPFLWWSYRFQTKWQRKQKVKLMEMTADRRMTNGLYGYLIGVILICFAYLFSMPHLAVTGQIVAILMSFFYIVELIRIFRY